MGRKKVSEEKKKIKISVSLDKEIENKLYELNLNKSKFINWLLVNYINKTSI